MISSNSSNYGKMQGFKKKSSNSYSDYPCKGNDKLGDLKSKLQKEREMMKKTGRRFREQSTMSTQEVQISTDNDAKPQPKSKHDISIGPEQPAKQTISLKDISMSDQGAQQQVLKSSRVFEKQIKQQKKRSKEVHDFLTNLGLGNFAEPLIKNGFDEVEMLTQLKTQDLNGIMMRAQQQITLLSAIESLKTGDNWVGQANQVRIDNSSSWRAKTEPMETRSERVNSSQILSRMKASQDKQFLKPGSFLYSVGSRNWSVEDQVRRACSVCFRVQQQMEKKGDCYYCSKCFQGVSEDVLNIWLGTSMRREYKKFQHL